MMTTATTQGPPFLVVETMSPDDRMNKLNRRICQFLKGGVAQVWLLDPEDQAIMIFRQGGPPEVLEGNDELAEDGVLPDFRCRVADFFFMPDETNAAS